MLKSSLLCLLFIFALATPLLSGCEQQTQEEAYSFFPDDPNDPESWLEEAKWCAYEEMDANSRLSVWNAIASLQARMGYEDEAIDAHNHARHIATDSGIAYAEKKQKDRLYWKIIDYHARSKQYKNAEKALKKIDGNTEYYTYALMSIAKSHAQSGDYDKSFETIKSVDYSYHDNLYEHIALLQTKAGEFDQAMATAKMMARPLESFCSISRAASEAGDYGIAQMAINLASDALKSQERNMKSTNEKYQDYYDVEIAALMINLAEAQACANLAQDSEQTFAHALSLLNDITSPPSSFHIQTYVNFAKARHRLGNSDEAKRIIDLTETMVQKHEDRSTKWMDMGLLARTALSLGIKERAIEIVNMIPDSSSEKSMTYAKFAEELSATHDKSGAMEYFERAIKAADLLTDNRSKNAAITIILRLQAKTGIICDIDLAISKIQGDKMSAYAVIGYYMTVAGNMEAIKNYCQILEGENARIRARFCLGVAEGLLDIKEGKNNLW